MASIAILFFSVLLLHRPIVNGEALTNATCATSFSWMSNSVGHSPCLVAAELQSLCSGGDWTVPALPHLPNGDRQAYNSPDASNRNVCICSWAVYNLMSACAACQDGGWRSWPVWSTACGASENLVAAQAFPSQITIPSTTLIPIYAAKDPSSWTASSFNVTEAKFVGSGDFTQTSSASTQSSTTSPTLSPTTTPSGQTSTHTGAIVGGVLGGVLGILLLALLAVFLLCPSLLSRRRSEAEPAMTQNSNLVPRSNPVSTYTTSAPPHSERMVPQPPFASQPTFQHPTANYSSTSIFGSHQPYYQHSLLASDVPSLSSPPRTDERSFVTDPSNRSISVYSAPVAQHIPTRVELSRQNSSQSSTHPLLGPNHSLGRQYHAGTVEGSLASGEDIERSSTMSPAASSIFEAAPPYRPPESTTPRLPNIDSKPHLETVVEQ